MTSNSPAVEVPENGYTYDVASDFWKDFCRPLPSTAWIGWPGYHTAVIVITIDKVEYVIQCWKGWCERFPNVPVGATPDTTLDFPGGIGAEVCIYRRDPARPDVGLSDLNILGQILKREFQAGAVPADTADGLKVDSISAPILESAVATELPSIPGDWTPADRLAVAAWLDERFTPASPVKAAAQAVGTDGLVENFNFDDLDFIAPGYRWQDQWFGPKSDAELEGLEVTFTLRDPLHGDPVIPAYKTSTYWTCKWMHRDCFQNVWYPSWRTKWEPDSTASAPPFPGYELLLDFSIGKRTFEWHVGSRIVETTKPVAGSAPQP